MKTGILLFGDNFDYPTLLVAMARALDVKQYNSKLPCRCNY